MSYRYLDIRLLRTFVAVAQQTGFSRAGDYVCRTQAAVSQQMKRLELAVGKRLLEREGRCKRLTDDGIRLLEYATRILNLNDEAITALRCTPLERVVRLGACADVADTILPAYVARINRFRPGLQIDIEVGPSEWLGGALRRGEIDLAIDLTEHDGFDTYNLQSSPLVWIASQRFKPPGNGILPLALLESPNVFRRKALKILDHARRPWRAAFESPTLCGLRAGVRAGLGITPHFMELVTPDLKLVGSEFELPNLPPVSFQLCSRRDGNQDSVRKIAALFGERVTLSHAPLQPAALA